MTSWRETTIAELASPARYSLATGPFGSAISSKHFVEDGTPVLRGSNLSLLVGVRLDDNGLAFLSAEKAATFERSVVRKGDLIFTCWGTIGQVGLIDGCSKFDEYVVSNKQMKLTPDPAKADSLFLYYLLSSPEMVGTVQGQAIGAAVPGFNLGQLRELRVRIPPLPVQQIIARSLGALDDLIENNRRRIELVERIAHAIYREWFGRFRYPGHGESSLVQSALGLIPEGWEIGTIDQIVSVAKSTVDPSLLDPETPAVGLEHIPRRQLTLDAWGTADGLASRKTVFRVGDILFGKIRPYFHKVSVAPVDGICSTDAIVIRPADDYWGLAVFVISSDDFVGNATQTANGTKMPRADWKIIKTFPIVLPPVDLARHFTAFSREMLVEAQLLMLENRQLGAIRDRLLPRLVGGQIDLSELDFDSVSVA